MESSDSDDYQPYTRAVENITLKRQQFGASLKRDEPILVTTNSSQENHVIDVTNTSFVEAAAPISLDETIENGPRLFTTDKFDSESDDDLPLATLVKKRKRQQRRSQLKKTQSVKKKKQKQSRPTRTRHEPINSQVIVFDDDTAFTSLAPIDFNNRYRDKNPISQNNASSMPISLDSSTDCLNNSDDETLSSDHCVKIIVRWYNGKNVSSKIFKLQFYQKMETIYEELARMEDLPTSRILLMSDSNVVRPGDTPSSLKFEFYGSLEGSVTKNDINHSTGTSYEPVTEEKPKDAIQVKLQLESKSFLFTIKNHQKLDVLYKKCAAELKCEESKIKLTFDGEHAQPSDLLSTLDVEDGDVFHVHVKQ